MASSLERCQAELNYKDALLSACSRRISILEDALRECRCAMQDIRDDGWLIKAIAVADKALADRKEAQA